MMDIQEKNEIISQIVEETFKTGFSNIKTISEFGFYNYYIFSKENSEGGDRKKSKYKTSSIFSLFGKNLFSLFIS